jgi:DNA-binding response OmpR family regulator
MKVQFMEVSGGLPPDAPLRGCRILVVEDEILIALTAQDTLTDAGAAEIVIATRSGEAATYLAESHAFDAAVIDLNLGAGFDFSLAMTALERRIPLLLATGYGRSVVLPAALTAVPILTKPYTGAVLVSAVRMLIERGRRAP